MSMRRYTEPSALLQHLGGGRCGMEHNLASACLWRLRNCVTPSIKCLRPHFQIKQYRIGFKNANSYKHVLSTIYSSCSEDSTCFNHLSGALEWRNCLRHCISVLETSLQTPWFESRLYHNPSVIGSPVGRRTIGPASSGVAQCRPSL